MSPADREREATASEVRLARAYLLRVAEPPAPALHAFVGEHGPIAAAHAVRTGEAPDTVVAETSARRELRLAERDVAAARQIGARLVIPEDREWPEWPLLSLDVAVGRNVPGLVPPLALWVRGEARIDELADGAVAVVGARAATAYGDHTTAELAYELAGRGVPVFSGAAYGIDGAAHRGALARPGRTAAVLGCGLDVGYPAGHVALLGRIANSGAVISEYPPGTPPARHRFLVRNRLIAALTDGTVVAEAGRRSGAKNTASTAGALGKVVMAVPGPVSSAQSVGCHAMIRSLDATLVTSAADVLDTAGKLDPAATEASSTATSLAARSTTPSRATDELDEQALRVHEALASRSGKSPERLATESGVPIQRVRAVLPAMELDGLSERCASGWRRAGQPRSPTAGP